MRSRAFTRAGRSWAKSRPRTNVDVSCRHDASKCPGWSTGLQSCLSSPGRRGSDSRFRSIRSLIADTWGYLRPALSKLIGAGFIHGGRNFVYPGFLFLLLRVAGDFRVITITQHLLGLIAGGVLLLTWRRLRVFVPSSRLSRLLHDWVGLIGVAIFLVAGEPIRAEMQLRPEAVCAFLLSLNLYFAIGFIARTFVEPRRPAVWLGIWTAFTALLLFSVKPSFVFMALIPLLPVGIFFLRRNWFWQKIALGSGAVIGATCCCCPSIFSAAMMKSPGYFCRLPCL